MTDNQTQMLKEKLYFDNYRGLTVGINPLKYEAEDFFIVTNAPITTLIKVQTCKYKNEFVLLTNANYGNVKMQAVKHGCDAALVLIARFDSNDSIVDYFLKDV